MKFHFGRKLIIDDAIIIDNNDYAFEFKKQNYHLILKTVQKADFVVREIRRLNPDTKARRIGNTIVIPKSETDRRRKYENDYTPILEMRSGKRLLCEQYMEMQLNHESNIEVEEEAKANIG